MFNETIAQAWADFRQMVVPRDASQVQLVEMERAFYAGYIACLTAYKRVGSDEAITEEQVGNWLVERDQEARVFVSRQMNHRHN